MQLLRCIPRLPPFPLNFLGGDLGYGPFEHLFSSRPDPSLGMVMLKVCDDWCWIQPKTWEVEPMVGWCAIAYSRQWRLDHILAFLLLTNALGIVMMNLISAHGIQIQVGLDNKGVVSASPRNNGQRCHCLHRMLCQIYGRELDQLRWYYACEGSEILLNWG